MTMLIDQDGNLQVRGLSVEAGHGNVLDDGSSRSLKGSDDPETENGDSRNEGTQGHKADFIESGDTLADTDHGEPEPWKQSVEEVRGEGTKDDASMARSRALQQAVSQGVRQAQLYQQQALPQQPSVIRWERFLPQQQLRVLLVEDDDATRHVVSALLRNCCYEVTSAANGLLAWELLMDQSTKVDLVLTEVVMPCLSGIGLLARIMSHEPLKHIPVIMMSSHDSMGVVFKCLSKGAVDFLVKPVRKNELKNLWQHIWRRCHSSSGSGSGSRSGSGSQTQKAAQPDVTGEADNSGSNDESDNASSELNIGGGSDNGSGTQSSWTKKAIEVESSHQGVPGGLLLQLKIGCVPGALNQEAKNDVSTNLAESQGVVAEVGLFSNDKGHGDSNEDMVCETAVVGRDSRHLDASTEGVSFADNRQRASLVKEIPNKEKEGEEEQQAESEDAGEFTEKHASNSPSSKDKTPSDSSSPSLLKLSLKRPCPPENDGEHEIRGLKHSCSSAFSRYQNSGHITPLSGGNAKTHAPPTPFGDHSFVQGSSVGSSKPQCKALSSQADRAKGGSDEQMTSSYYNGFFHVSGNQDSNVPHNFSIGQHGGAASFPKDEASHRAIGSAMQMQFPPPAAMSNAFGTGSNEPVSDSNLPPHWGPSAEKVEVQEFHLSYRHSQGHHNSHANQDPHVHHHSHHHHHHHHHIQHHYHHHQDELQQRAEVPQLEDSTLITGASAPKCGSSNVGKGVEGNNVQCGSSNGYGSNGNGAVSLNGSASGSNNGSNGGQSAAAEPAGVGNVDDSTQPGGLSGVTAAHQSLLGPDQSRHARREAALTKFRQKRKERCFEKKVRYQSRKRLAEQRPRVRGQFVRQSVK
ncbi:hypothetical protein GOP47_0007603 [Adiantum capillus-veneris]|uniref:Uncharacterized protein n=1 Tax=Adiantum capillus-veneris TaxID=13818 RepID=A0A9D4V1C7_ADICA|nr:hypothetical protein GOP47_0007603 [Adiantum capillus-veneris]